MLTEYLCNATCSHNAAGPCKCELVSNPTNITAFYNVEMGKLIEYGIIQGCFITLAVSKRRPCHFETVNAILQPNLIFQSCEMVKSFYNQYLST